MSTLTACNRDNESYPSGYNSCWEWVASLPSDQETANLNSECSTNNDTILAGSDFVSRKRGIQGTCNGGKHSASDIYQLAIATRKARERQSVVSISNDGGPTNNVSQDRAFMLRSAFAAQRLERTNSEGTYSFDSSTMDVFGLCDAEESFLSAESLLIQLGFGGPSQGLDRIPQRFLQASQMRGVDIDQFFATQQELDDTFETGSLGYRGLTGPPTRRPSSIVARLYERMLRKNSGPTTSSSFENPPGPNTDSLTLKLHPDVLEEESVLTPTNPPSIFNIHPLILTSESRKSSLASSRRSSLRRQGCIDVEETTAVEPPEEVICQQSEPSSSGFASGRLLANASLLPTVYVTPPPSTIFSQASLDMPESITTHEIDPIISVLQLAAEAYRIRLDIPTLSRDDGCDWNHNLDDVKEDIRHELNKTDDLLQRLKQRLSHARSINQTYDSSALRGVLADMITLLQQQQRLYRQVNDLRCEREEVMIHNPPLEQSSLLTSSASSSSSDNEEDQSATDLWLRSFERRITVQIRKTVRRELRRVRPTATAVLRSKLKKSSKS